MRISQVPASSMDAKQTTSTRKKELTPAQQERQRQQRQFERLLTRISDTETVFEVRLSSDEKPITVRQRLLRAADEAGKEIAVRKSPNGFYVGLMTPERRSNRGRKKQAR